MAKRPRVEEWIGQLGRENSDLQQVLCWKLVYGAAI